MGCSIACNLALTAGDHGLRRIVLLERDTLGSGSTGRSSGAVRMHYSTAVNAELAWRSLHIFRNFDDMVGGECGYTRTGYLVFAGADDLPSFRANIATQQSVGVITDIISAADAAELAPGFEVADAAGIAYEPYSGHADASGTAYAYATRARREGVTIRLQTPAEAIETSEDGSRVVAVRTAAGERIETSTAVVATGPWTARFLAPHGIEVPSSRPAMKSCTSAGRWKSCPTIPAGPTSVIASTSDPRARTSPWSATATTPMSSTIRRCSPNAPARRSSRTYGSVWPAGSPPLPTRSWHAGYAGLYTNTPDFHPIMDRVDGVDGLYLCTGFSGHGFKLSPMVGVLMAEMIGSGAATTMDISPLKLSRFGDGALNHAGYGFDVLV